jgi:apolipoprotein N-acyltransferase
MASNLSELKTSGSPANPPTLTPQVRWPICLAALIASLAGFYLGTGLHPLWPLLWIAPVPLLILAPRVSHKIAFASAFIAFAGGSLNEWHYAHSLIHMPAQILILFLFVPAIVFALGLLLYRGFGLRGMPVAASLALPSLWVAYEYLSALASPHSTFGNLGYTQITFLPFIQLASLTGIWGLSFFVFLFGSTASVLLRSTFPAHARRNVALVAALLYLAIFSYGIWRLNNAPNAPTVRVALAASDTRDNLIATNPETSFSLLERYAGQVPALAAGGAKIIIFPEHTAIVTDDAGPNTVRDVDALFVSAAAANEAFILIGVDRATANAHYNEARFYSPTGLAATYHKQHLLPPFENVFTPGSELTTLGQPSGLWGLAICKDMDFPHLAREYGKLGVGLLLVPAWDFNADGWLHGRMAILRGVESGFSIARSAKQGILAVSDDRGRVLAQRATTTDTPFVTLVADAPVGHTATLYSRLGDWFANLNLALFGCLLVFSFVPLRRPMST